MMYSVFVVFVILKYANGHGRLIDPPSRNAMWRFGFANPENFNDNELYCGGFSYQWSPEINGRCGACGDPFGKPQPHIFRGKYANNIITRTYSKGQIITVKVDLTSNHKGYFTFRIGDIGNPPITVEKLNHVLKLAGTEDTRYYLPPNSMNGIFTISLKLPMDLVCRQCVLQWYYTAGNNWGTDSTGSGVGKGPQESFVNCADVRIVDGKTGQAPPPPPSSQTNQNQQVAPQVPKQPTNVNPNPVVPNPPTSGANCKAAGAFANLVAMTTWCQLNCPVNCPATHCICT